MEENKLSQQDFIKLFTELWYAYSDRPMNEMQAVIYFKHLKDYPADRLFIVIDDWIKKDIKFPHISSLIEEMKITRGKYNLKQIESKEDIPTKMPESIKDIFKKL